MAIGEVGELAGVGDAEFDITKVIDETVGVVDLVDGWAFGVGYVDDDESLFSAGDEGPVSGYVEASGIMDWECCCEFWMRGVGHIKDFESIFISNETIAELEFNGTGLAEYIGAEHIDNKRFFGVLNINDHESGVAADPRIVSEDGD